MALDKMVDSTKLDNALTATADAIREKGGGAIGSESGAIVTVTDAVAGPANSVTIPIEPVQDLHGYDSPWPAGGGKNKYPILVGNDVWVNNGSATHSTGADGSLVINTSSSSSSSGVYLNTASATMTSVLTAFGADARTISMDVVASASGTVRLTSGNTNTWTIGTTKQRISIVSTATGCSIYGVSNGATLTVSNVQIEAGSTATSFAPYENICPISGWDAVGIERRGVNLLDTTVFYNGAGYNASVGTVFGTSTVDYVTETANGVFTIAPYEWGYHRACLLSPKLPTGVQMTFKADFGTNHAVMLVTLDSTLHVVRKLITRQEATAASYTQSLTLAGGEAYVAVCAYCREANTPTTMSSPRLFVGTTDISYEPFTGNLYSITIGQTVYGGTLDVTTGELTVTHRYMLADGVNVKTAGGYGAGGPKWLPCIILATADKVDPSTPIVAASYLKTSGINVQNDENTAAHGNSGAVIALHIGTMQGTDGTHGYNSASEVHAAVNAYLQQNPLQLCYKLATSATVQLTPTEVQLLLGTNNVWSDTGNIILKYPIDSELIPFDLENETGFADAIGSISTGIEVDDIIVIGDYGLCLNNFTMSDNTCISEAGTVSGNTLIAV